jgi:transposase InsO family protein
MPDLYSRKIVSWVTNDRLTKGLATTALSRGIAIRRPEPGLIHHSDRGSQYCSYEYCYLPNKHDLIALMSRRGNCYYNSMVETVFEIIKNELHWCTAFQKRKEVTIQPGKYIDGFYNPRRRHSALGINHPSNLEPKWQTKSESLSN